MNIKPLINEFVAAAFFVLCCVACTDDEDGSGGAMHFGTMTAFTLHLFGTLSGAQINPIVTLACYIMGLMDIQVTALYIVAQIMGSMTGYGVLVTLLPEKMVSGCTPKLCLSTPHKDLKLQFVLFYEFISTCLIMTFWLKAWSSRQRASRQLTRRLGLIVTGLRFALSTLTNSTLNLATTLAAACWLKETDDLPLYAFIQVLAMICMCMFYKYASTSQFCQLLPEFYYDRPKRGCKY